MFFTGRLFDLETQRLKSTKCPIIFHFWLRGMWKNNKSRYNKTNPIYFEQFSGYLKSKSYLMTMAPPRLFWGSHKVGKCSWKIEELEVRSQCTCLPKIES